MQRKKDSLHFTPDLYAFLIEYQKTNMNDLFSSEIHPYFNFGDSEKSEKIESDNDFTVMFNEQCSNLSSKGLFDIINNGIKYGTNLTTSSIPVSVQIKSSEMVNSLKKNPNKIKSSLTFGDYSASQGTDLPYKSEIGRAHV